MKASLCACLVLVGAAAGAGNEAQSRKPTRIGVIGAGFAGASTAYYLRELCRECYNVTVFEGKDRVGGRVLHQKVPNSTLVLNAGGDAWSSVNTYLMELMKELGVDQPDYPGRPYNTSGLYHGPGRGWSDMPNKDNDPNFAKDRAAMLESLGEIKAALVRNYKERGDLTTGEPYDTVEGFAEKGMLSAFSSVTLRHMIKARGVSDTFTNNLIVPATRDIYDQTDEINGFAGMAVMLSAMSPAYSCKGGNDVFVQKLFSAAADMTTVRLNSYVSKVALVQESEDSSSFYVTANGEKEGPFDRIVLAAPFEKAGVWNDSTGTLETPLVWDGFSLPTFNLRSYVHWYVIWLSAKEANPGAFDHVGPVPDMTLTPEGSTATFVKLAAEYAQEDGFKVFRFFSNNPIDDLDKRFTGLRWNKTFHWPYTFPDLSPPSQYQPVKLHPRVYYPNAMESMAVAMEVAVIGGRNAAQQIHRDVSEP